MSAFGIKPCIEEALQQFLKANEGETDCMLLRIANQSCYYNNIENDCPQ